MPKIEFDKIRSVLKFGMTYVSFVRGDVITISLSANQAIYCSCCAASHFQKQSSFYQRSSLDQLIFMLQLKVGPYFDVNQLVADLVSGTLVSSATLRHFRNFAFFHLNRGYYHDIHTVISVLHEVASVKWGGKLPAQSNQKFVSVLMLLVKLVNRSYH